MWRLARTSGGAWQISVQKIQVGKGMERRPVGTTRRDTAGFEPSWQGLGAMPKIEPTAWVHASAALTADIQTLVIYIACSTEVEQHFHLYKVHVPILVTQRMSLSLHVPGFNLFVTPPAGLFV
jgi:hypothetical protein